MDPDLEQQWQEAVRQKNLAPGEIESMVEGMELGITIPHNWNRKCEESIRREREEVEKRYSISIGQTSISCARCGKPWGFGGHTCQDIRFKNLKERAKKAPKIDVPLSKSDFETISCPSEADNTF